MSLRSWKRQSKACKPPREHPLEAMVPIQQGPKIVARLVMKAVLDCKQWEIMASQAQVQIPVASD